MSRLAGAAREHYCALVRHASDGHTQGMDRPTLLQKRPASDDMRHDISISDAAREVPSITLRSSIEREKESSLLNADLQEQRSLRKLSGLFISLRTPESSRPLENYYGIRTFTRRENKVEDFSTSCSSRTKTEIREWQPQESHPFSGKERQLPPEPNDRFCIPVAVPLGRKPSHWQDNCSERTRHRWCNETSLPGASFCPDRDLLGTLCTSALEPEASSAPTHRRLFEYS